MSYLDQFAPPAAKPSVPPSPEQVSDMVEMVLGMVPGQNVARFRESLLPMLSVYAAADDFERDLLAIQIRDACESVRRKIPQLHRLPTFLAAEPGEDTETYLDRCYLHSGFIPANGTWRTKL